MRDVSCAVQSPLFAVLGRLTQQYVLDMYACTINDRLDYIQYGNNPHLRMAEVCAENATQ
jgi:hypothetical protein